MSDILGDHAISCGIGGERIARHNHVRDAVFQTAVQAGLGPVREPAGLLPGSDDRPADVLIPFWTNGQDTAWDVTVVNPLQAALVVHTSQEGQSAVESAHMGKVRKYEERCSVLCGGNRLHSSGSGHPGWLASCCPGSHNQAWSPACQECGQGRRGLRPPPAAKTGSAASPGQCCSAVRQDTHLP